MTSGYFQTAAARYETQAAELQLKVDAKDKEIAELKALLKRICRHDSWYYEHDKRLCSDCGDDIGKDDS